MTKKTYALAGLGLTTLLLASCSGDNVEEIQSAVGEIDQIHGSIVDEINGLSEEEMNLQTTFDDSLASDDQMSTFADGSAPVFENITSRRDRIETINTLREDFESQEEIIADYDGDSLSEEELSGLNAKIDEFSGQLGSFTSNYESSLTAQEDYFTSIGSEDATYDTFSNGITELNEQTAANKEELVQLDRSLVEVKDHITQVQEMIQSTMTENE
ncbi:YkyA family protein [Marinilactibacillus sp. Marseille-P9653]|uniref:YkyA family protein n=1 Tax=Marinilactibacillus sp. Marseille-P9653 TaxID=2866583 RepID=UPI001CE41A93|nr:YkyA family protein [Marinilactibacillus sp. Marseille-P9653]